MAKQVNNIFQYHPMHKEIPDTINNAKVLFVAETDGLFDLQEHEGRKIEISVLAICQQNDTAEYQLLGCDANFRVYTEDYFNNLEPAFENANRTYSIEHITWRQCLPVLDSEKITVIFISMIDGTAVWFPAKTEQIGNNQFLILDNDEFDCSDYTSLPQFIPGDIVSIAEKEISGEVRIVAESLITPSSHPDKSFFEFMYNSVQGIPDTQTLQLVKYSKVIDRIKRDSSMGRYFYAPILKTVDAAEDIKRT